MHEYNNEYSEISEQDLQVSFIHLIRKNDSNGRMDTNIHFNLKSKYIEKSFQCYCILRKMFNFYSPNVYKSIVLF